MFSTLHSKGVLWHIQLLQERHVSLNTIDDLNSVPHANTIIYELYLRHLITVTFDSFADGFNTGSTVKEFISVLYDWRLCGTNDLTSSRVYMHVFTLLKVGKSRVENLIIYLVFELALWLIKFPKFSSACGTHNEALMIKLFLFSFWVFKVNLMCALEHLWLDPIHYFESMISL